MREIPGRVTRRRPCGICGGHSWCLYYENGDAICNRSPNGRPCGNSGGYLYKKEGHQVQREEPQIDWGMRCAEWARNMTPARRSWLEGNLELPKGATDCLLLLGYNRDGNGGHYTIPFYDGKGMIIGCHRRYLDGRKLSLGHNGLFVGVHNNPKDVIYVVEGASDTMALVASRLTAIGRPSNCTGAPMLADLLAEYRGTVVVVGERDERPNGLWPGQTGMVTVADQLRVLLKDRRVITRLPPEGYKDARSWCIASGFDGAAWTEAMNIRHTNGGR